MVDTARSRRWLAALVAIPLAAGLGVPATASADTGPTCRGQGIDPDAVIHYRTETFVKAQPRTVWRLLTDVEDWPSWQAPVTSAQRLDHGPLRDGSRFRWTTPAPPTPTTPATTLVITSTVQQLDRTRCVRWSGPAIGEGLRIDEGVHVWNLVPVRGGVVVRTEESWTGEQIEADPATAIQYLAPGLDAWLADLKTTAEARGSHR
jgi:hypothetical protein